MKPEKENPQSVDFILADNTGLGADGGASLPSKIARYSEARHKALTMQSFAHANGHVKEANKLLSCANYLVFRHYFRVDKVRLHAASFCRKHLLCPMCAIRRGSKMLKAYLDKYETVRADNPHLKPYLITLTVKNGDDLSERIFHLRNSMRKMTQSRRNSISGKIKPVQFSLSQGGFHSIEVTNKGEGWHPHVHMIWLCGSEPDQRALSAEWLALTGDSYIVDSRPLHDPVEGFLEVCKYALKFSDLSPSDNFHAYEVMSGQRLIDAHGLMRGVNVPESLLDEQLDDQPFIELFYKYVREVGYTFKP